MNKKDSKPNPRTASGSATHWASIIKVIFTKVKDIGFGPWLMMMSVSLIFGVGSYIVLKFSYGINLPVVSIKFPDNSDKLGQFGDFFGGVLNPLLSFMALLGVLYTIRTQGQELKEAREETRIANRIQDKQSAIFERQNFESVFFRLIDVHARMSENIRNKVDQWGANGFEQMVNVVMERYDYLCQDYYVAQQSRPKPQYEVLNSAEESDRKLLLEAFEDGVRGDMRAMLSQYYRNIYQILKLIDAFKVFASEDATVRRSLRQAHTEYFHKRQYSNILRAQFSDDELKLLFINCLTSYGAGLKEYVEQYSLLKHSQKCAFLGNKRYLSGLYDETAYADYEDISISTIMGFSRSRTRNRWKSMFSSNPT